MIGKMLLDIKMEYFKEGEGAFSIQVKREGKNIVLETAPKKVKPEVKPYNGDSQILKIRSEPVRKWSRFFLHVYAFKNIRLSY